MLISFSFIVSLSYSDLFNLPFSIAFFLSFLNVLFSFLYLLTFLIYLTLHILFFLPCFSSLYIFFFSSALLHFLFFFFFLTSFFLYLSVFFFFCVFCSFLCSFSFVSFFSTVYYLFIILTYLTFAFCCFNFLPDLTFLSCTCYVFRFVPPSFFCWFLSSFSCFLCLYFQYLFSILIRLTLSFSFFMPSFYHISVCESNSFHRPFFLPGIFHCICLLYHFFLFSIPVFLPFRTFFSYLLFTICLPL